MYVCTDCGQRYERDGFCGTDGSPLVVIDDPLLGTEIGRYQIARVIGQGGMGRVYLAVQPHIGSRVAVKVLSDQCARDPDLLERFFAEARTVNLIRHEHIVSVIDLAQLPDGRPYIVMEYVEGQTLARATRGGRAPLGGIVQVVTETLSALAAAHAHQIVHRDLKPDNIIVTVKGHAKVLDFGIAKLSPGLQHPMSPRTRTGALLGTPAYMAPEQISGAANVDARTDVYAAGVVLFEAITGTLPFSGATAFDLMRAQLEDAPVSVRDRRIDVPEVLARVIARALAKAPADRFQTASAMNEALHAATAHLPGDQLRALSGHRASLPNLTSRDETPAPSPSAHGHTPPAFSAVVPPPEAPRRETSSPGPQSEAKRRATSSPRPPSEAPRREVAPQPAPRAPWRWIAGAVGLAGVAVAATVVVMSRDPDPPGVPAPVATSPSAPAVTSTPPPAAASAAPAPTATPPSAPAATSRSRPSTDASAAAAPTASTSTPPPAGASASAAPTATPPSAPAATSRSRPSTDGTAAAAPIAAPTPPRPRPHRTEPAATASTPAPAATTTPPAPPRASPQAPQVPAAPTARGATADDLAREALAKKWNRHRTAIALPGEHPIARRPRVAAAPRYDATNVDYRKLVASALALGRKELPGAHLVAVRVRLLDGRADLTSTSHIKLTFELGSADRVNGDCTVKVEFGPRQVDIYFDDSIFCNSTAIRAPTCSAASVWERAGRPGDGKPSTVISMSFNGASWELGRQRIPDDC